MTSRWVWHLSKITRRMWFRASLFSILAVLTALVAIGLAPYIPSDLPTKIGADAVDNILGIIASSMLAVTTFSLSTMVAAYAAATSNVTPRATRLVMEDTTTQNVLATFIGAFLYSLVGIIALSTGAYGSTGRVVLFVVTAGVIVLIVVTLLRWIDHLSRLGRVSETTQASKRQQQRRCVCIVRNRIWAPARRRTFPPLPCQSKLPASAMYSISMSGRYRTSPSVARGASSSRPPFENVMGDARSGQSNPSKPRGLEIVSASLPITAPRLRHSSA